MNARQLETVRDLFGAKRVERIGAGIAVDGRRYPVVDDVVILVDAMHYTPHVRERLHDVGIVPAGSAGPGEAEPGVSGLARDVQSSFGAEWSRYGGILEEHRREFEQYFDLLDLETLRGRRVADLGCGAGRWSHFLRDIAGELVLVDFSDAIFVARRNLADAPHAVFFMADVERLPFRDRCFDLAISLGVLHHLPTPCLEAVRRIGRLSPRFLVYLYYALDNRPWFYRALFGPVDAARRLMSRVKGEAARRIFASAVTWTVYIPMVALGRLVGPLGLSSRVPLYDFYAGKSAGRIEQDVYDRFFTGIEQRVTRTEIEALRDTFPDVTISSGLPYWHFLCSDGGQAPRAGGLAITDRAPATDPA